MYAQLSTTANLGFGTRSKSCQHLFVVAMMTILILPLIADSRSTTNDPTSGKKDLLCERACSLVVTTYKSLSSI